MSESDLKADQAYAAEVTAHIDAFLAEVTAAARRHRIVGFLVVGAYENGAHFRPLSRCMMESAVPGPAIAIAVLGATMNVVDYLERRTGIPARGAQEVCAQLMGTGRIVDGEPKPS